MNNINLNKKDIEGLNKKGLNIDDIGSQIEKLNSGNIPVSLIRPASLDDGVIRFSREREQELSDKFEKNRSNSTYAKFVPASGAASRMFSKLTEILNKLDLGEITLKDLMENDDIDISFTNFFNALKRHELPFFDSLKISLKESGLDLENLIEENNIKIILEYILDKKGLKYGSLPKALVKFHKYADRSVSPIGEHFIESVLYAGDLKNNTNIHFTIPEQNLEDFQEEVLELKKLFKLKKGYQINTEFSFQMISTNTISINKSGEPVRDNNGDILLRAGGHGSLIGNLNKLSSDIIFIKNIDNITTGDRLNDIVESKKIIGAYLIEIRDKIFNSLKTLPRIIKDGESINEIYCFAKDVLNISLPAEFIEFDLEKKRIILLDNLNRPVRVCGMVKNMNEPGGAPFWIENRNGETTLQIIEGSQVDKDSSEQKEIFTQSSYFNPVDIVCSIKNHRGNIFDLNEFIEETRYFISEKSHGNEKISVLEHPGLWNGSMEKWISLYVEVPLTTFNPVKYVNDLLKDNHKPSTDTSFSELF